MTDIVQKLKQSYHLDTVQPEHPVLRAVREIERLRESEQRFMQLASEARRDADALRRDGACPHIRSTSEGTHHCALAAAPQPKQEPVAWAQKEALEGVREYGEITCTLYAEGYQPEQEWTEPLYLAPQPAPDDRETWGIPHASMIRCLRAAEDRIRAGDDPADVFADFGWAMVRNELRCSEVLRRAGHSVSGMCLECGKGPCLLRAPAPQPEQEPVAWIQFDHLQKARVAPFLSRVEPTQRRADFVAIYTTPQPASDALREAARLALKFCEFCWRDVPLNDYAEEQRSAVETALREALGESDE